MGFDFSVYDYNDTTTYKESIKAPKQPEETFDFGAYQYEEVAQSPKGFGLDETAKDVGQQIAAKGAAGSIGSYGNILDALGLQLKEGQLLPGQKNRIEQEFDIVNRLNNGEKVSAAELALLSDDDLLPTTSRLPSSEDVNKQIKTITGVSEGKTAAGRMAGRGAQFAGEIGSLGGGAKALLSATHHYKLWLMASALYMNAPALN